MTQARAALDWRSTRRQHPPCCPSRPQTLGGPRPQPTPQAQVSCTQTAEPAPHPRGRPSHPCPWQRGRQGVGPGRPPDAHLLAAPRATPPRPRLLPTPLPGRPSPGLQRQPRQLLPTHPRLPEDTGEARWWGKVYPSCPGTGGCIPAEDPNSETLPARPSPARPLPLPCSSRPRPPDQAGGSSSGSWDSPPPPPPSRALRFFDISAQGWGVGGLLHTPALPPQREE